LNTPEILRNTIPFDLNTILPSVQNPKLETNKTTLIYNYYNLDPYWYKGSDVQRIFLMEPSFFKAYPVSQRCIDFVIQLSKNIDGIKLYVGEFANLYKEIEGADIIYKEHPTTKHYIGKEESRDWLSGVKGYYPSFFSFWKKCKKEL
jgi:deoxyribodipyrimidine photo-lyase